MAYNPNTPLGRAIDLFIASEPDRQALYLEVDARKSGPEVTAAFDRWQKRQLDDLLALQTAFYEATSHINSQDSCFRMSAEDILKCAGGRVVPPSVQAEIRMKNGRPEECRDDLRLKPYAEHLGFSALTNSISDVAVPQNGYSFERDNTRVWATGDGWQVADVINDKFSNHRKYASLLAALSVESGVSKEDAVRISEELASKLVAQEGPTTSAAGMRP